MLPVHFPELYSQTKSYLGRKTDFRRQWGVTGARGRTSEFDDEDELAVSVRDIHGGFHDSTEPMRHNGREVALKLMRQNSDELSGRNIDAEQTGEELESPKKMWFSSLNKSNRSSRNPSAVTIDREYSFSELVPSAKDRTRSRDESNVVESDVESGVTTNKQKEETGADGSNIAKFRRSSLLSIHNHRSSRDGIGFDVAPTSNVSDLSVSTSATSSLLSPVVRKRSEDYDNGIKDRNSTNSKESDLSTGAPSNGGSTIESGRFDYDQFIPRRDSTFDYESKASEVGKMSFETNPPPAPKSSNSIFHKGKLPHFDVKKHRFMKFRLGNKREGRQQQKAVASPIEAKDRNKATASSSERYDDSTRRDLL